MVIIGILVVIIVILSSGYFAPIEKGVITVATLSFLGALAGGLIAITGPVVLFFSNNRSASIEKAEKLSDMWYDIAFGNRNNFMPWEISIQSGHKSDMAFEYWKRFVFYGHMIDRQLRPEYYQVRDYLTQEEELKEDEAFKRKHHAFRIRAIDRIEDFESRLEELRSKPLRSYHRAIEITEPQRKLKT